MARPARGPRARSLCHEASPITSSTCLTSRHRERVHSARPLDARLASRVAVGTSPRPLRADDSWHLLHTRCLSPTRCARPPPSSQPHLVCRLVQHRTRKHHGGSRALGFTASRPPPRRCSRFVHRGRGSEHPNTAASHSRTAASRARVSAAKTRTTIVTEPSRRRLRRHSSLVPLQLAGTLG